MSNFFIIGFSILYKWLIHQKLINTSWLLNWISLLSVAIRASVEFHEKEMWSDMWPYGCVLLSFTYHKMLVKNTWVTFIMMVWSLQIGPSLLFVLSALSCSILSAQIMPGFQDLLPAPNTYLKCLVTFWPAPISSFSEIMALIISLFRTLKSVLVL